MKNVFKKAVSLTVALSTVAALSVSAFAAEITEGTATYDATNEAVKVEGYTDLAAGQYAVAVVPADFTGDDADIFYVNQADEATIVTIIANMLVKGELADGEYEVRIGNNVDGNINVISFTVSSEPTGDFITSEDTDKATMGSLAATATDWFFTGVAKRVTINLNTSKYADYTQDETTGLFTKNYTLTAVDANGVTISDIEIYFSAQSGKYVVLVPENVADGYKFQVAAETSANTALGLYGDANANNKVDGTDKTIVAGLINGKNTNATFTSTNQRKLRLDVDGNGKFNATDKTVLAGHVNGKVAKVPAINK